MDPRRSSRTVIDPKVLQVGFFAPSAPPDRSQSGPPGISSSSPPLSDLSASSGNSLLPVMIPPPRHLSDIPRPLRRLSGESIPVGSYNPSEFVSRTTEFSNSGKFAASSLPAGGFDTSAAKQKSFTPSSLTTVSMVHMSSDLTVRGGGLSGDARSERSASSKPLKEKSSKAERRALQEAQRAAKAAAKAEGKKAPAASGVAASGSVKQAKVAAQKKESSSLAASEKKGGDRPQDKDRKKEVPHPRLQFDDKSRVDKAKNVQWSNKLKLGTELNCLGIYLNMNMEHVFLILSQSSSTLIQFTQLFTRLG